MKHINIRVEGRVQGVFYRASARDKGEELGLKGFARNEADGSVYIECEGEQSQLDKFIEWCHDGPQLARVTNVKTEEGEVKGFSSFRIER